MSNKIINFLPTDNCIVRWLVIILTVINFSFTQAQNLPDSLKTYYDLTNKGEYALYKKEFQSSSQYYNCAFKAARPQVNDVLNIIKAYHYSGKRNKALKWIKYAIISFGITIDSLTFKDYIIPSYYSSKNDFRKQYSIFNQSSEKIQERAMINHYIHNDIFFRNQLENLNFLCLDAKNSYKLALRYDSVYAIPFIIGLIQKYQFPNAYDIGYLGENNFLALIRHYNIEKNVFDNALIAGQITPKEYASIVDYHFNWDFEAFFRSDYNGGPLKPKKNFGVNMNRLPNGKFIIMLPDEVELVDERRHSIGLPPLWQTAEINGYMLPKEYIDWLEKNKIQKGQ